MHHLRTFTSLGFLCLTMIMSGCLEDIQQDTGQLVTSMENMDKNTASIAASMEKLEASINTGMENLDKRMEGFQTNFEKGIEKIESMEASFAKMERLFEMVDYVKEMSESIKGLTGTMEKIDELADEAKIVMSKLSIDPAPSEAEQNVNNFIPEEEADEISALLGGETP